MGSVSAILGVSGLVALAMDDDWWMVMMMMMMRWQYDVLGSLRIGTAKEGY